MTNRNRIINESVIKTLQQFDGLVDRSTLNAVALSAAENALDAAGFSDESPQASPRPPDFSPRTPGKTGNYGPSETRKAEQ